MASKKSESLNQDDLANILKGHAARALGYYRDEIAEYQEGALRRYFGEPYGDEEEGKSQVVSKDVAQVVDWALPDLMEPFVAGERAIEFLPDTQADESIVDDASEYCNFVFSRDNKGFFVIHDAFKDGAIQKVGVTKVSWEVTEELIKDSVHGVSPEELAMVEADDDVELDDIEEHEDGTVSALVVRRVKRERCRLTPIPPEEFLIDKSARTIKDSKYTAHRTRKTLSELREMGFEEDVIADLPSDNDDLERTSERYKYEGYDDSENDDGDTGQDKSQREVWLYEEFVRADYDGDGIAELLHCFRVDNKLLDEPKEVQRVHMAAFCPVPISHRFYGESLADKAMQDQRAKTSVTRQLMDNLYLANSPRTEVPEQAITEDGSTIDDLLNPRVGGLIRTAQPGLLRELAIPDNTGSSMAALELFDSFREQNTGIIKSSQGMESDTIDKSATEAKNLDRGAQARKRLMARIAAEGYMTDLFALILHFVVTYQQNPRTIKVGDEWKEMIPSRWSTNLRPVMRVGLGHTHKDEKMAAIMGIYAIQKEGFPLGLTTREHVYNLAQDFVEAAGQRDVRRYFADPEMTPEPQQPPDPKVVEAQMKAENDRMKMEMEAQLEREKMQMEMQLEREKMLMEFRLKAMMPANDGSSIGDGIRFGGEVG